MPDQPNIIYILSDEHCGFAMSHMGDANVRTPHMDQLATEGISFRTAYANCPVCTPSRGTIFSGRHAHAGPVQGFFDVYKATAPSSATILRSTGYHTAYFGKWHCGVVHDQISPEVRQNPDAYPEVGYFRRTPEYHRGGFQDWYGFEVNNAHFHFSYYHEKETSPRKLEGYQTDVLTDLTIQYMEGYESDEPLFLVLSVEPPHFPLEAPEAFKRFDPATLSTRKNFFDSSGMLENRPHVEDSPWMRERLAIYYAMIENLDWNIGRLLETLARLPHFADNTLIVYISEHGDFMGSHGLFERKEHPQEESVRIPAIFNWPGRIPAQGLQEGLFSLVDLLPTTLGLTGVPIPAHLQGADFSPACRDEPFQAPEFVFLEMHNTPRWGLDFQDWRGLVSDSWKYAFYETGHEILFDLKNDPYELNNLAAVETGMRDRLREQLLYELDNTSDPYFQVLIEHGTTPDGPVLNLSKRWRQGISPAWKDQIKNIEE